MIYIYRPVWGVEFRYQPAVPEYMVIVSPSSPKDRIAKWHLECLNSISHVTYCLRQQEERSKVALCESCIILMGSIYTSITYKQTIYSIVERCEYLILLYCSPVKYLIDVILLASLVGVIFQTEWGWNFTFLWNRMWCHVELTSRIVILNVLFWNAVKCPTSGNIFNPLWSFHEPTYSILSLIREGADIIILTVVSSH